MEGDNKMKTQIQRQIELAVTNGRGYLENDEIRAESVQLGLEMLNKMRKEQLTPEYLEMVSRKKQGYRQDLIGRDIPTYLPLGLKEGKLGIIVDNLFQPIAAYQIASRTE